MALADRQREVEQRAGRFGAQVRDRLRQNVRRDVGTEVHRPQRGEDIAGEVGRVEPLHVDQVFRLPGEQASGTGPSPAGGTGASSAAARTADVSSSRSTIAAPIECPMSTGGDGSALRTRSTSLA